MPRIKLEMPENYIYSTEIDVRVSDINYGNHLGNDALVALLHEARIRFLDSLNYSELDIEGYGIIMSDLIVVYKSQVFRGESVRIEITIQDFTKKTCDFFYKVSKEDNTLVARCKTTITFFDYTAQKPVSAPLPFIERVKNLKPIS
jgi:acyl-CoA thioester hydrolase